MRPRMSSQQQNGNNKHDDIPPTNSNSYNQKLKKQANDTDDERLLQLVRDTQKEAAKIRSIRRTATLKSALIESRDRVLELQLKKLKRQDEDSGNRCRINVYPTLLSTQCPDPQSSTQSAVALNCRNHDDISSGEINISSNIVGKRRLRETRKRSSSSITNYSENSTKSSNKSPPLQIRFCDPKTSKEWTRVENHQPLYLEATTSPVPPSTATVFLKSQYAVEDMQDLMHVPYFNDHDEENIISEHFDTRRREELMEDGPLYQKEATDDAIDETLTLLLCNRNLDFSNGGRRRRKNVSQRSTRQDRNQNDDEAMHKYFINRLQHHVAKVMNVTIERVLKRYDVLKTKQSDDIITEVANNIHSTNNYNDNGSFQTRTVYNSEAICKMCKDDDREVNFSYSEHVMDSFRNLLCRRCHTYDCNNHGNLSPPDIIIQTKLAIEKERNGDWVDAGDSTIDKTSNIEALEGKKRQKNSRRTRSSSLITAKRAAIQQEDEALDGFQKLICEHVFQIFQGDTEKIAAVIGCNVKSLRAHVKKRAIKLKDPVHIQERSSSQEPKKKKRKVCDKKSMKYYNPSWLKRVKDTELHPPFDPCNHEEPCSFETCSCVQNAFFCTKHCVWGAKSRNFFRGCSCKAGQCRTMSCTCFAAKRECDPDLCTMCGACTDPPNKSALRQRCRNDNIGMRRHCHLLLAKSGISGAGWGIYTKHAVKKGDFIHEYIGEVISQEEAERRGAIYDKENRSYLFNLSSEGVVDARRKGNKTKFANHSSNPNCCSKVVVVNGDYKIGLFAKEDIEAQSELFFDYRYDVSMSHELLIKPSLTVDWMKTSKAVKKTYL